MLDKVHNYDPSIPVKKYGWLDFKWSVLFFLDFTFSILNKKDDDGKVMRKQEIDSWWGRSFKKLHNKTVNQLKETNPVFDTPFEVPSINEEDFNKEFWDYWRKNINTPIIVKGFLKDAPITSYADRDNLVASKGDMDIKYVSKATAKEKMNKVGQNIELGETSLRNYLTLPEYQECYLNNFYGILNDADFDKKCRGKDINALHKGGRIISQWFISRSKETASTLHCANGYNMFLNIKGNKEWYFIDPSYTPVVQPALSKYAIYAVSEMHESYLGHFFSEIREHYSEMKHVPIYKTVLEEGDMLINPSYWWHRVRNLTDYTVGCATRYEMKGITPVNGTYAACVIAEAFKHPKRSIIPLIFSSRKNESKRGKFIYGIFSGKKQKKS